MQNVTGIVCIMKTDYNINKRFPLKWNRIINDFNKYFVITNFYIKLDKSI